MQNRIASWVELSSRDQRMTTLPRITPAITGVMLRACLPKAEKPMIVRMPPMVGPFRSPPVSRSTNMPIKPFTPILTRTGAGPNIRRKSLGDRPLVFSRSW